MNKPIQISKKEKKIIDRAVRTAFAWGLSLTNTAEIDLQEYNITVTEEHKKYIFRKYVEVSI